MSLFPWLAAAGVSGLAGLTNPIAQPGEPSFQQAPAHHLRMTLDNDVFFSQDKDYTNGLRFDYAQRMQSGNYWGLSLTQNMYTPATNAWGNVQGEHPYGGNLSLGAAYLTCGERFGTSTEFQLGTSGKASLAEEAQDLVHGLGNMEKWYGWDDQIRDELTIQLSSRQDFGLASLDYADAKGWQQDGMLFLKEELGTVSIAAQAGFVYRFGKNLPARMRNMSNEATDFGVSTLAKPHYDPTRPSYFMLAAASLEYVARDMFIDGGAFHDFDQTCSRTPWIAEIQLGMGVIHKGIDYYFGAVYRSDSYSTQDEATLYGTFSIGWNW